MMTRKCELLKTLSKWIPITMSPRWKNFLCISCDLDIPIYFTLGFGKHLFHFCFLPYDCLGITRKLFEQLRTYPFQRPDNSVLMPSYGQRSVSGEAGVHLLRY